MRPRAIGVCPIRENTLSGQDEIADVYRVRVERSFLAVED